MNFLSFTSKIMNKNILIATFLTKAHIFIVNTFYTSVLLCKWKLASCGHHWSPKSEFAVLQIISNFRSLFFLSNPIIFQVLPMSFDTLPCQILLSLSVNPLHVTTAWLLLKCLHSWCHFCSLLTKCFSSMKELGVDLSHAYFLNTTYSCMLCTLSFTNWHTHQTLL